MAVPTGDGPTGDLRVVRFLVPSPSWFSQILLGAIERFFRADAFDHVGSVTPGEAQAIFESIWESYSMQNNNVGQIVAFACDNMEFNGRDPTQGQSQWRLCNGDFLSVVSYPDLYARIGNTWGGDSTVFGLPDLQGRVLLGVGAGPGSVTYALADSGGEVEHTLSVSEMPSHAHTDAGHSHDFGGTLLTSTVVPPPLDGLSPNPFPQSTLPGFADIQPTGGDQPHENRQPYTAFFWYIQVFP